MTQDPIFRPACVAGTPDQPADIDDVQYDKSDDHLCWGRLKGGKRCMNRTSSSVGTVNLALSMSKFVASISQSRRCLWP